MKTKTLLLAILTLVIGVIIGALGVGRFTMHKIHRAMDMHTERGFMDHNFESLDIAPELRDSVQLIMRDFAKSNHQLHQELDKSIHEAHVQLEKDLSLYLYEDQLEDLRKRMRFNRKGPKRRLEHRRKNNQKHRRP
jgi:uncharacterized membrane-anchored protein YhcB (DUF1043 family)